MALARFFIGLFQMLFCDEIFNLFLQGFTFRVVYALILCQGFYPGFKGFGELFLRYMQLSLTMQYCAAFRRSTQLIGDGSGIVVVAPGLGKMSHEARYIAQTTQGASFDLAGFLGACQHKCMLVLLSG